MPAQVFEALTGFKPYMPYPSPGGSVESMEVARREMEALRSPFLGPRWEAVGREPVCLGSIGAVITHWRPKL